MSSLALSKPANSEALLMFNTIEPTITVCSDKALPGYEQAVLPTTPMSEKGTVGGAELILEFHRSQKVSKSMKIALKTIISQSSGCNRSTSKRRDILRLIVGVVVAIATLTQGIQINAESAQATASSSGTKMSAYALIPETSRVPAPDFNLTDVNGQTVSLSQFRGKVVLLDFWAVECGGCKVEIPWYVAFDKTYRDKGLSLIGIDMYGESAGMVKTFMEKTHMNYRVAIGNDELGKRFHVQEMPLTLLIDRDGRIALSHAGIVDKTQFENAIQKLLE